MKIWKKKKRKEKVKFVWNMCDMCQELRPNTNLHKHALLYHICIHTWHCDFIYMLLNMGIMLWIEYENNNANYIWTLESLWIWLWVPNILLNMITGVLINAVIYTYTLSYAFGRDNVRMSDGSVMKFDVYETSIMLFEYLEILLWC